MKGLKLKLVYWLMKSMRMRFVAFEINKDETLSIQGNIHIMEFDAIMNIIKEIESKEKK
jgi:hypothetical protein